MKHLFGITIRGLIAALVQLIWIILAANAWIQIQNDGITLFRVTAVLVCVITMGLPFISNGFRSAEGILDPITERLPRDARHLGEAVTVIIAVTAITLSFAAPAALLGATTQVMRPTATDHDVAVYAIVAGLWLICQAVLITCAHIGNKRAERLSLLPLSPPAIIS